MEAYRIERFSGVNGTVLRSSEDPGPGLKDPDPGALELFNYCDLMVLKDGSRSDENGRSAAV